MTLKPFLPQKLWFVDFHLSRMMRGAAVLLAAMCGLASVQGFAPAAFFTAPGGAGSIASGRRCGGSLVAVRMQAPDAHADRRAMILRGVASVRVRLPAAPPSRTPAFYFPLVPACLLSTRGRASQWDWECSARLPRRWCKRPSQNLSSGASRAFSSLPRSAIPQVLPRIRSRRLRWLARGSAGSLSGAHSRTHAQRVSFL